MKHLSLYTDHVEGRGLLLVIRCKRDEMAGYGQTLTAIVHPWISKKTSGTLRALSQRQNRAFNAIIVTPCSLTLCLPSGVDMLQRLCPLNVLNSNMHRPTGSSYICAIICLELGLIITALFEQSPTREWGQIAQLSHRHCFLLSLFRTNCFFNVLIRTKERHKGTTF